MNNVDQTEIDKFSALASRWWDPNSEFKPLHEINPLRLNYIQKYVDLSGKTVLDVGCGGGILAESVASLGAKVTGIDLAEKSLEVAKLHLKESQLEVDYQKISVEELAEQAPHSFDTVLCMEMLEHVPHPDLIIKACEKLVKPGGNVFFSTINRNIKSYLFAIVGAEYILNLLPKGTHDHDKFIKPSELSFWARQNNLTTLNVTGMQYNPISKAYSLGQDTQVNYIMATKSVTT